MVSFFSGLTPPLSFNSVIVGGVPGSSGSLWGFKWRSGIFWDGVVVGVRTPNLEHQMRTLYALHHAPPGFVVKKYSGWKFGHRLFILVIDTSWINEGTFILNRITVMGRVHYGGHLHQVRLGIGIKRKKPSFLENTLTFIQTLSPCGLVRNVSSKRELHRTTH